MKALKESLSTILFALFELIVGILLLISPVGFTVGIIRAAGLALIFYGVVSAVKYFRTDVTTGSAGQTLAQGMGLMLMGGFCVLRSEWFIATFPVLTILYGVSTLFGGLSKIQLTVDLFRRRNPKWFWGAISSVVSLVCALIILMNPFATTAVLWTFTGVSLIAEAVVDAVALFESSKGAKG